MRRTRIRQVSRRRQVRDRYYQQARQAVYDRAGGFCEAFTTRDCTGYAEQVHHVAGRAGPDPHRLDNLLACCARCHDHIHSFPSESYRLGLMVRRNGGAA